MYKETRSRGYHFDKNKIDEDFETVEMMVTDGQLVYEMNHLSRKLKTRDENRYRNYHLNTIEPFPFFQVKEGSMADWEIQK